MALAVDVEAGFIGLGYVGLDRCRDGRRYRWQPPQDVDAAALAGLDDVHASQAYNLILRLFDFGPWRPILAQRFRSQFGPPVFDPVSLALGILLARWRGWGWTALGSELRSAERRGGYWRRLGFDPHDLPGASTWRAALKATDEAWWLAFADGLVAGLMDLELVSRK